MLDDTPQSRVESLHPDGTLYEQNKRMKPQFVLQSTASEAYHRDFDLKELAINSQHIRKEYPLMEKPWQDWH